MFRSKPFEKTLEKATSNLLLEPDFDSMLQLCDMIRGGDIKARDAVTLMKARIKDEKNPNVLDTVMKNCGDAVHEEVITQPFLEELKDMAKTSSADRVKGKVLEMVQAWGIAFKDNSDYKIATNLYNVMKAEGYDFPAPTNTADMFKSEKAPVWKDGDDCSACKTEFGIVQRKHHCRACGGIFCNRCTSKQSIIPKFGIEKEVRVCDKCYNEINSKSGKTDANALPQEYLNSSLAKESQVPPSKSEQQLKEEEELQIAIAMSLNEQENQTRVQKDSYATINKNALTQPQVTPVTDTAEMEPELARYLNRNYWEKKKDSHDKQVQKEAKTDAKKSLESKEDVEPEGVVTEDTTSPLIPPKTEESLQNGGLYSQDNEEFLHSLRTSVEIFMNRMRSDQMRNRSITNDSAVQSLFQSINLMHPTLLQLMNDLEEKRLKYEALQDKLTQIRDARAALDALREEHKEKVLRAAEEAERIRQIQMARKLEIMRQKKQEYLAYQRQIALQRMQEQEAARHARLEKQKQFIMQRAMQPAMIVQGYNNQYISPQSNIANETPVPVQTTGYSFQGQSYPSLPVVQSQSQYGQQIVGSKPPLHYPNQQIAHAGQYQPEYTPPTTGYHGTPSELSQPNTLGITPSQDTLNMSGVAAQLPQQQNHFPGQVVASAPPPTPQATPPTSQQIGPVSQPLMMQIGKSPTPHQQIASQPQQYYQQAPQQEQQPVISGASPPPHQPDQSLLISFD